LLALLLRGNDKAMRALTLLAAGITAAMVPASSVPGLALALGLLGLGWNLGLVSGTTIITDEVPLATRARTQGTVDLCIAVAGAGGGLTSGMIVAATDYTVLAVTGGVIALSIVPALALSARSKAKTNPPAPAIETPATDSAPR
jgi:MFS family permease